MPQLLPDRPQPFPNRGTSGLHVIRHEAAAGANGASRNGNSGKSGTSLG
jgi:hypothetical protein